MANTLKYWLNGEPVTPEMDENVAQLRYWLDGKPFVYISIIIHHIRGWWSK